MNRLQHCLITLFCLLVLGLPNTVPAASPEKLMLQDVPALLEAHKQELSRDLRHIRREIAALRADLNQPGMKEVFAGIGYICGLFGVAAFVASRRRE